MDLRQAILQEHSRAQCLLITKWVGRDSNRLAVLLALFMEDEYRVVQRAAWIISMIAQEHPDMLAPHLPKMVQRMQEDGVPVAVKRNVTRVLQYLPIPEALHDPVMDTCFMLLEDVQETIAVRCFAMTVLARLAKAYPDISRSIRLIIEDTLQQGASPAFRSRARKVLKELD
ncbi:hypothetical protein KTO58_09030 [Chitinophaga pendula]|uniref:hypothetical protein n=1 Tax=Chitinophaga TaxID=79328 RepID=UPI000BAF022C|nr:MULTISPECIES: hypothetical protein [Chitinophaga]ASZ13067.1 hypothetical protein CK934_19940 [Chitinophaga sp. MD30]UCJ09311.1 hypothetical protein KTO58_09030 [Chitinophaga pendula]